MISNESPTPNVPGESSTSRLAALVRAAALGLAFAATLTSLALPIGVAYLAYQRWILGHSLQEASLHLEDAMLLLQGIGAILALVGAVAWVTLFLRRVDRQGDLRTVGLAPRARGWRWFGAAFAGGMLLAAIPIGLALASGQLGFGTSHASLEGVGDVIGDALGSVVMIASLILAEELVFRGYMAWTLRRSGWAEELAALFPALLFAIYRTVLVPSSWAGFLNAFAAGVLLGLLTQRTRSLHVTIGARLGWALVLGTVFSLPVAGAPVEGILHSLPSPGIVMDNAYGPDGSWLITALLGLGIALAQWVTMMKRRR